VCALRSFWLRLCRVRVDQGAASSQGNNRGWYVNSQGQTMVIVRGPVEFDMGEGDGRHRERNGHSFAISAKEVSVEQFQGFVKDNPRIQVKNSELNIELFSPEPTCPMNQVSWYDAAAYCNWLSKQEGLPEDQWCYGPNEQGDYAEGMKLMSNSDQRKGYRLPTEAEWEYACRAGAVTTYSFGEPWELVEKYGWYTKNSPSRTQPVGRLKPNDLGLFDLHGNIGEWCRDIYKEPQREYTDINLYQPVIARDARLVRGGSFVNLPADVRSAFRNWFATSDRFATFGFRPSRTYH
jgi:formylglycine-generating enzyme required for sulfatase activity